MDRHDLLDGFQLHDNLPLNNKIQTISDLERVTLEPHRQGNFLLKGDSPLTQLHREASPIRRLKQPRP